MTKEVREVRLYNPNTFVGCNPDTMIVTYRDLFTRITYDGNRGSKTEKKTARSRRRILNLWLECFDADLDDKIAPHLSLAKFPPNLDTFEEYLKLQHFKENNLWVSKSTMKSIHSSFISKMAFSDVMDTKNFAQVLDFLMKRDKVSSYKLGEAIGLAQSSANDWRRGLFLPKDPKLLEKAEKFFKLPKGKLQEFLPADWKMKKVVKNYKGNQKKVYRLKVIPPQLQAELDDLYRFKTAPADELDETDNRHYKAGWRKSPDGDSPTGDASILRFKLFFGFLNLKPNLENPSMSGLGLDSSDFSLAMLLDKNIVLKYGDFLWVRNGYGYVGQHKACSKTFLHFLFELQSMTRHNYGYLNQRYDLIGSKSSLAKNKDEWLKVCDQAFVKFGRTITAYKSQKSIISTRDPFSEIERVLDLQRPISELEGLLENLNEAILRLPTNQNWIGNRFRLLRARALVAILSVCPVRSKNIQRMCIDKNLYRKPNGIWHLKYAGSELKNWKSPVVIHGLDTPLEKEDSTKVLSGYIDEYIAARAKHKYASKNNRVFLQVKAGSKIGKGGETVFGDFRASRELAFITTTYSPNRCTYRCHAFRHILATHFVKNFADGIRIAAAALYDTEIMITHFYSRFSPKDKSKLVLDSLSSNKKSHLEQELISKAAKTSTVSVEDKAQAYIAQVGVNVLKRMTSTSLNDLLEEQSYGMANRIREIISELKAKK